MSRPTAPADANIRWLSDPANHPEAWKYGKLKSVDPDGTLVVFDLKHGFCRSLHRSTRCQDKAYTRGGNVKWKDRPSEQT